VFRVSEEVCLSVESLSDARTLLADVFSILLSGDRSGSEFKEGGVHMKTLVICHDGAALDQEGLARWLGSFSDVVGLVVLRETGKRARRRISTEIKRVGPLRFIDVLAFRLYYRLFLAKQDRRWEDQKLEELRAIYPALKNVPVLMTHSPNSEEAERFIQERRPDIMIARCKSLLKETIFSIPTKGTLVMHPGICPEYRNAHGCFWALANGDRSKVGMTMLRIDKGVDTGPVFGYYLYSGDDSQDSHVVIQHRVVLDNLEAIGKKLHEIFLGEAIPIDTKGRKSSTWGQPWLTKYLGWKSRARRG
jgi:folate-dependent phosphoribosylglycinamide formyltransferase PurN